MPELKRFLKYVSQAENGCHEWNSTLHRDGYGKFYFRGKQLPAHRVSYMLQVGEIKAGMWVLHNCDNRKCVNPEHLYLGDAKQNVKDKIERCSWWGNMRIPKETVQKAIDLYEQGWTQQRIADHIGVHQTQVSRYIRKSQRKRF